MGMDDVAFFCEEASEGLSDELIAFLRSRHAPPRRVREYRNADGVRVTESVMPGYDGVLLQTWPERNEAHWLVQWLESPRPCAHPVSPNMVCGADPKEHKRIFGRTHSEPIEPRIFDHSYE